MKFNLNDYKGKYVMHCKTEEEAEIFCKYLHNIEHMWGSGDSYLSKNYWNDYEESTCYEFNADSYCSKRYYEERKYTILEMEDFMEDEETVSKFTLDDLLYAREEEMTLDEVCRALGRKIKIVAEHQSN